MRMMMLLFAVLVPMAVVVVVLVLVIVPGAVCVLSVLFHDKLGGRHTGAENTRCRHFSPIERKAPKCTPQFLERQPGIEKRPEHHVTRRAVETVEIQDPGHSYPLPSALCTLLCQSASVIVYQPPGS